jgi:hypothetical protein
MKSKELQKILVNLSEADLRRVLFRARLLLWVNAYVQFPHTLRRRVFNYANYILVDAHWVGVS